MDNSKKIGILEGLVSKNMQTSLNVGGLGFANYIPNLKEEARNVIDDEFYKMNKASSFKEYIEGVYNILYCAKKANINELKIARPLVLGGGRDIMDGNGVIPSYKLSIRGSQIQLEGKGIRKLFNGDLNYEFVSDIGKRKVFALKDDPQKLITVTERTVSYFGDKHIEEIKLMGAIKDFLPYINDNIGDIVVYDTIIYIEREINSKDNLNYIGDIFKSGVGEVIYEFGKGHEFIEEKDIEKEKILLNEKKYEDILLKDYPEYNKIDKFNELYNLIESCLNKIIEQQVAKNISSRHKK